MTFDHHFGEILRFYRKLSKVTQDKLSEAIGMDRTYISMLERGKRFPSLDTVIKISHALNIKASDLIHDLEIKVTPEVHHVSYTHTVRHSQGFHTPPM